MDSKYTVHENTVEGVQLEGRVVKPLITPDMGAHTMVLSTGVYEKGRKIPIHFHEQAEEVLYILSGSGVIHMGDLVEPVTPGTAVFIPIGVPHYLEISSEGPMHLVFVFSPPITPGSYPEQSHEKPIVRKS